LRPQVDGRPAKRAKPTKTTLFDYLVTPTSEPLPHISRVDRHFSATLDLGDVHLWLQTRARGRFDKLLTSSNVKKIMKSITALALGHGLHANRPGIFYAGVKISLQHDLDMLKAVAKEWLPDSDGWLLTHPISYLQKYKASRQSVCELE
jgi:hypothetical protein